MESRSKGTVILRYSWCVYKVTNVGSGGDNNWTFECKDRDKALPAKKNPKDILFLDNNDEWKVVNEDQLRKL